MAIAGSNDRIFGWGFRLFAKDEISSKLKEVGNNFNAFTNNVGGFVNQLKFAGYAILSFYATSRVLNQVRDLLYLGQGLEQTQLQLQSLTGSVKEARGLFEFARRKAEELPFGSVQEIANSIKTMNLFGFSAQKHFDVIAQLAAASGESLEGVVYNLNFFTQSGFGRGLARMGVNIKELQKSTQGLRPGTDAFREATIKYLSGVDKFKNAIAVQRNSISGLKDDIADIKEAFKLDILGLNREDGLMGGYKRFLRTIRNFLVSHKEGLKEIAVTVGRALGGMFDIMAGAFKRLTSGFGAWIDKTGMFLKSNQNSVYQFIFWLALVERKIESIITGAWKWINKIVDVFGGWKVVLAGIAAFTAAAAVSTFGGAVFKLAEALGAANPTMLLLATALSAWTVAYMGGKKFFKEYQGLSDSEKREFWSSSEVAKAFIGMQTTKSFRVETTDADIAAARAKLFPSGINANINNTFVLPGVTPASAQAVGRGVAKGMADEMEDIRKGKLTGGRRRP